MDINEIYIKVRNDVAVQLFIQAVRQAENPSDLDMLDLRVWAIKQANLFATDLEIATY